MATEHLERVPIPRDKIDAAALRRTFAEERTGIALEHVAQYSFNPSLLPGNIENFTGDQLQPWHAFVDGVW